MYIFAIKWKVKNATSILSKCLFSQSRITQEQSCLGRLTKLVPASTIFPLSLDQIWVRMPSKTAGWMCDKGVKHVQTHKRFEVSIFKTQKHHSTKLAWTFLLINTSYQSKEWTSYFTQQVSFKGECHKTCQEHIWVICHPKIKRRK